MAAIYQLEREQFIPRPVSEVFAFFADAGNLEIITPPWLHFKILTPLPIEMKQGALIDYRLRMFGIPFGWRTRIEAYEPERRFIDTQIRGPYTKWWHVHEFEETPSGGTRMLDRVDYQLPLGLIGNLTHALLTKHQLRAIFDYRRAAIERIFGKRD